MRPVLRYAAFVALLSLPLAHGQDVQVDKGKHEAEISISGDRIKGLLDAISPNATEKNTTADKSPPIRAPQMIDLTGLGTPKISQQKTEAKPVEQEARGAGTTFKMPPKIKVPPPPAGETKEEKPSISLADLKAKAAKSSAAKPNVRRTQSFEHLARRPPGQLPPKDMKPVGPKDKDNATLRDRLAERAKKAEGSGLGGKRFLQSFEHPARRGPSPLSPKDIRAVKPKTGSSLGDQLRDYADAKDEGRTGIVSPLKGWIRYLLEILMQLFRTSTKPPGYLIMDGYHYVKCAEQLRKRKGAMEGVDLRRVLQHLEERFHLIGKIFVDSEPDYSNKAKVAERRRFNGVLEDLGFEVPTDFRYKLRTRRDYKTKVEVTCEEQSGVDVGISCLVLRRCLGLQTDDVSVAEQSDVVILCTGDGDFCYLLRTIKEAGKRVVVIGFSNSMASRLKDEADEVLFIDEMWDTLKHHKGEATKGCRYVGCPCKPTSSEPGTSRPLCAYHTCPGCAGIKRSTADLCFTCSSDASPEVSKCAAHHCTGTPTEGGRFCSEHSCFRCGSVKGRAWPTCRRCTDAADK